MSHSITRIALLGAILFFLPVLSAYCGLPISLAGSLHHNETDGYQGWSVYYLMTIDTPASAVNPAILVMFKDIHRHGYMRSYTPPAVYNVFDEHYDRSYKIVLLPSTRYNLWRVESSQIGPNAAYVSNRLVFAPASVGTVHGLPTSTDIFGVNSWYWESYVDHYSIEEFPLASVLCGPCGEIVESDGPQIVFSPAPPSKVSTETTQVILTGEARDAAGVRSVVFDQNVATFGTKKFEGDLWSVPFSVTLSLPPVPPDRTGVRYQLKAKATDQSGNSSFYPLCIDVGEYTPFNEGGENFPCQENTSPVNAKSGGYFTAATDLTLGPANELSLSRRYHAQSGYDGPLGRGWVHDFDWQLYEVTDLVDEYVLLRCALHNRIKFKKLADGTFQAPNEWPLSLTRGAGGIGYLLSTKGGLRYAFDATGLLSSIIDANSNAIVLSRDESGRLVQVHDAAGRSFLLAYGDGGKMSQLNDHTGRQVGYAYTGPGLLEHVTDPAGFNTYYQYTGEPPRISATLDHEMRPLEQATYDDLGRVATLVEGGLSKSFTRRPRERKTIVTDGLARTTLIEYDANGRTTRRTRPDGTTLQWVRDPTSGGVTACVGPT